MVHRLCLDDCSCLVNWYDGVHGLSLQLALSGHSVISQLVLLNSHQPPFADDIGGLAGEEEELANLVEHLDKASTAYGMEKYKVGQHKCHQR